MELRGVLGLALKGGEVVIVDTDSYSRGGVSGQCIGDRIVLPRDVPEGTIKLRYGRELVLLMVGVGVALLGESMDERHNIMICELDVFNFLIKLSKSSAHHVHTPRSRHLLVVRG